MPVATRKQTRSQTGINNSDHDVDNQNEGSHNLRDTQSGTPLSPVGELEASPPPAAQPPRGVPAVPSPNLSGGEETHDKALPGVQSGNESTSSDSDSEQNASDNRKKLIDINDTSELRAWRNRPSKSRRNSSYSRSRSPGIQLTKEQGNAIQIAQANLTRNQRELIARRHVMIDNGACRAERSPSPVAGPSDKGKGPDPRNWGGIDINEDELDLEAQTAAYESFRNQAVVDDGHANEFGVQYTNIARKKSKSNEKNKKAKARKADRRQRSASAPLSNEVEDLIDNITKKSKKSSKKSRKKHERIKNNNVGHDNFKPINQLNPKSYLGKVFIKTKKGKAKRKNNDSSEDSTSESNSESNDSSPDDISSDSSSSTDTNESSSDSSSNSDDSSSSSSSSESNAKRRKRKYKKSSGLRPVPPKEYDGSADPQKFHRYATTGIMFLKDGRVKRHREVFTLSLYLTGKAYTFYTREVALQNKKWNANRFLKELFNYCFPVDFRSQQRKKLRRCFQNDKTVKEYAAELNELFVTIGFTDKRERIHKFWTGLRPELQKALWRDKLNPETSSWKSILNSAEINEIAEKIDVHDIKHRDQYSKDKRRDGKDEKRRDRKGKKERRNSFGKKTNNTPGFSSGQNEFKKWENRKNSKPPQRKQLTDKERDELRAAGKCFNCKETGHQARHCPANNKLMVKSNGSGSSHMRNHNINIDLEETEHLRELANTTEGIDELNIGMIAIPTASSECEDKFEITEFIDYRDHDDPSAFEVRYQDTMGDALAARAEVALNATRVYPGDGRQPFEKDRFHVYQVSEEEYIIMDSFHDEDTIILKDALEQPWFNITEWYRNECYRRIGQEIMIGHTCPKWTFLIRDPIAFRAEQVLFAGRSYPGDHTHPKYKRFGRFRVEKSLYNQDIYSIHDHELCFKTIVHQDQLQNKKFNLVNWYRNRVISGFNKLATHMFNDNGDMGLNQIFNPMDPVEAEIVYQLNNIEELAKASERTRLDETENYEIVIELNGQQVEAGTYPAIQKNSSAVKDPKRSIPKPVVVVINIDGQPCRALVDSGSLGDFMSSTLAEQLRVKRIELASPIGVQLAVQGSRTKINYGAYVRFKYQDINENRYFDIINLSSYDIILGTPWLYQYQVMVGLNPARVVINSDTALPIKGDGVSKLSSRTMAMYDENIDQIRKELIDYAKPLCKTASETELPPLRAINHRIPLIDPHMKYSWRPSKCPEPLLHLWVEKRNAYIKSGRWKTAPAFNAVPMLCIPKPGKAGEPLRLRTVVDLRERNANTRKMTSPLPDMEGILRRVSRAKYRSIIDGQDAYEQIRIEPSDVPNSTMITPDGTMISEVMQQGDCNAVATFQTIMVSLFSPWIGKWIDIYLDDILIYSDSLEDHVKHVKMVIDILKRETFFLSEKKLYFLTREMKVLGHIIDDQGIRMDPDKVDALVRWKTPTNRDLLRGFLGSAGYLADDIDRVRIPMGILHGLTGDTVPFRWEYTHQRAFQDIKDLASRCKEHHRRPLSYEKNAQSINVVTDGCGTGIAGVVSQGNNWKTAEVAAFFSAKLNSAQQNYPVHEIEMLAGIETMMRHRDILQGVHFKWYTDHKGLIHLLKQKNLSGRQARWLEKISQFDFEVIYVPGADNILSDALSRLYSNDALGTVRARSEYTYHDVLDNDSLSAHMITMPLLVGTEGANVIPHKWVNSRKEVPPAETGRPETGREFAARVAPHFVLRGPKERKEGGNGITTEFNNSNELAQDRLTIRIPARIHAHTSNQREPNPRSELPNAEIEPPSLIEVVEQSNEGLDLKQIIAGKYNKDSFFKLIVQSPKDYKNFELENDLIYLKSGSTRLLCIPRIEYNGRNIREIVIAEAHSILAHLGARKTLIYLKDYCWWKEMVNDTNAYCETCITCKRSKPSNQKPYGLLNPLSVPSQPWESIGIDFVGPLPESKDRDANYDSITVIIDLMTSMVHLVPSRINYTARQVAELIFAEVYKHHGLPRAIISDRDVLFTSLFWGHLHKLIGTKLRLSSAYHPESDGSTERANRTVTQMLHQCISPNQKDWVSKLPAIEFAINSARSESTGYSVVALVGTNLYVG